MTFRNNEYKHLSSRRDEKKKKREEEEKEEDDDENDDDEEQQEASQQCWSSQGERGGRRGQRVESQWEGRCRNESQRKGDNEKRIWGQQKTKIEVVSESFLWGDSKGVINFPWIFYALRSLVPVGHFRNISGHLFTWLVCQSFQ